MHSALDDIGRNDLQDAAALSAKVGQAEFRIAESSRTELATAAFDPSSGHCQRRRRGRRRQECRHRRAQDTSGRMSSCPERERGFVGKIGKRSQVEELVDEFDDRAMLGGFMRDGVTTP